MKTIMIIDDSQTNLLLVQSIISDLGEGFAVVMEDDSTKALERIALVVPDLVILDIMMPDIDGISILQMMKAQKELKEIPVIILSALQDKEKEKEALDLGASCYLRKPLMPNDLMKTINKTLHQFT